MSNSLDIKTNNRMITIGGKTYRMDFDMQALSQAEQVYQSQFGRSVNVSEIIAELAQVKMSAVMALAYGALVSAGNVIAWKTFAKDIFTFEHFDEVFAVVEEALMDMFGKPDKNAAEAHSKN